MRGQAFIIFKDINSAMEAKRKLQSKELFGKKLVIVFVMERITFAKEKSDSIAKIEGTFNMREKPKDYFQKKFEEKFVLRPKIQS
jgi:RNA recognition motif-containing protein